VSDNTSDKLRRINTERWLRDNPGKSESDYRKFASAETAKVNEYRQYRAASQAADAAVGIVHALMFVFRNFIVPAVIAFVVGLFVPGSNFFGVAIAAWVILQMVRLFFAMR
jgi:hypothetical protein